jgi:hypothetical protein
MNVQITPDFRLTADERQLIVKARKLVDPTKAPNWKARIAADPTTDPTPREVWDDDDRFFSLNSAGLAAALESIVYRSASRQEHTDLAVFIAEIRSMHEALRSSVKFR